MTDLVYAIDQVHQGRSYFDDTIFDHLVREGSVEPGSTSLDLTSDPIGKLTRRERQILRYVAEGLSTKEIAALLTISSKTVTCHRARIMEKLDTHRVAGLVQIAVREGLVAI